MGADWGYEIILHSNKPTAIYNRLGFWWGFVGNCIIKKKKFIEVPIKNFQRKNDVSTYKLINIFKIIIINFIGLIKIRLNF